MTHKNRYDYSLVHYKNNITNIKIICPIHGEFQQTPKNHINGHGCPLCATECKKQKLSKSNLNFVNESKNRHDNFYEYNKTNYINSTTKIIVTCPIHGDFKIAPTHHLSGIGCNKCSNNHVPTNEEFIIKANKIHRNKYDYSLIEYKNNKTKIKIICAIHGIFEQRPIHHLLGSGCQKCNTSKGEIIIDNWLIEHKFKFEKQKRFSNCKYKKPLPFDFYISQFNLCIEFDGEQHFSNKISQKRYLETVRNDKIKNDYCNKNNINLIRISYKEKNRINEILTNKLNKMT
jgi:very-short-patch-repair endonuclease